ncbi:MAG TPA: CdaR family protein [Verrucomicrobiae bacterium]
MTRFLLNIVLKDIWLKLFSLALATLAWFVVDVALVKSTSPRLPAGLQPVEVRLFSHLPVVVMSSAEDVRSMKVNPKEVEVTVRGDRQTVQQLQAKDIRVIVDLTGIEAAHDLKKRIEVSTPAGVTYVKIDPEEVQVIFPPKP